MVLHIRNAMISGMLEPIGKKGRKILIFTRAEAFPKEDQSAQRMGPPKEMDRRRDYIFFICIK